MKVYDRQGTPMSLDKQLGKGGEATVYPLEAKPHVVFKRYHDTVLAKRSNTLLKKLDLMHRVDELRTNKSLCWPLLLGYDDKQKWIGYAMYRISALTMSKLAHAVAYEEYFPGVDRKRVLQYLLNLLNVIDKLHQKNIMIGDYNLNNILLDPKSDQVTLVDCDSYQISLNGEFFPCEVGSPDLTPREHQDKPFKDIVRNKESEYFSIAIILFKAFMLGRHPYDIVGGAAPEVNLKNGIFPYVSKNKNDIPKGCWHVMWTHIPDHLQQLFIQVFTVGSANPSKRPSLAQWRSALNRYLREINQGLYTNAIKPALPRI